MKQVQLLRRVQRRPTPAQSHETASTLVYRGPNDTKNVSSSTRRGPHQYPSLPNLHDCIPRALYHAVIVSLGPIDERSQLRSVVDKTSRRVNEVKIQMGANNVAEERPREGLEVACHHRIIHYVQSREDRPVCPIRTDISCMQNGVARCGRQRRGSVVHTYLLAPWP